MIDLSRTVFILGAKDPEMDAIDAMLMRAYSPYLSTAIHALSQHKGPTRVTHKDAYEARVNASFGMNDEEDTVVLVECDGLFMTGRNVRRIVIDHHRQGDPGFDKPPAEYWEGASIGQLAMFLENECVRRDGSRIPRDLLDTPYNRLVAAIDHARFWAVRGECPGIDAIEAQFESKRQIAEQFGVSAFAVTSLARSYYDVLATAPTIRIGGRPVKDVRFAELGEGYSFDFLVLQEAAMLLGVPYISLQIRPGSTTVFLNRVDDPATVEAFMKDWAPKEGLQKIFGVPLRGYAGGIIPEE